MCKSVSPCKSYFIFFWVQELLTILTLLWSFRLDAASVMYGAYTDEKWSSSQWAFCIPEAASFVRWTGTNREWASNRWAFCHFYAASVMYEACTNGKEIHPFEFYVIPMKEVWCTEPMSFPLHLKFCENIFSLLLFYCCQLSCFLCRLAESFIRLCMF